jgi:hypothetical protein
MGPELCLSATRHPESALNKTVVHDDSFIESSPI